MSIPVQIGNSVFNYPSPGDEPGWGDDATQAFLALAAQIQGLTPATDIVLAQAVLSNGIASPTTIANLELDSSLIYGAICEFTINRMNNSQTATEQGVMEFAYSNGIWYMDRSQTGTDTGITFTITNGGLVQYTSTSIGATDYSGIMTFRLRSFPIILT